MNERRQLREETSKVIAMVPRIASSFSASVEQVAAPPIPSLKGTLHCIPSCTEVLALPPSKERCTGASLYGTLEEKEQRTRFRY